MIARMSEWRVLEWSKERGRGAIHSPHFRRVEFDASICDVDDLVVGELVHIQSTGTGSSLRVARLWPDLPRFREGPGAPGAPDLDEEVRADAEAALAAASGVLPCRAHGLTSSATSRASRWLRVARALNALIIRSGASRPATRVSRQVRWRSSGT
jgi:hypothetical protein